MSRDVIVEVPWVCDHEGPRGECGHENRGRDLKCAVCGHERSLSAAEKIDAAAPEVTDPALLAAARADEHWVCLVCPDEPRNASSGDPATDTCQRCGSPRDLGAPVSRAERVILEPDFDRAREAVPRLDERRKVFTSEWLNKVAREEAADERARDLGRAGGDKVREILAGGQHSRATRRAAVIAVAVGGLLALGLAVVGLVKLLLPREVRASVVDRRWDRSVEKRRKTAVRRGGWGTPAGAFNASCSHRQRGTVDCDPYDCSYPESYSCPYACNPHRERYECGREQTSSRAETYECRCRECRCRRTNCRSTKNGFATCSETCDRCCDTCSRQVPVYGPKFCERTAYDQCPRTCTRVVPKTCYRQCPRWDDWCDYDEWEWPVVDHAASSGFGSTEPAWPAVEVGPDEKIERSGTYTVTFGDERDRWEVRVSEGDFARYPVGSRWVVEVGVGGAEPIRQDK